MDTSAVSGETSRGTHEDEASVEFTPIAQSTSVKFVGPAAAGRPVVAVSEKALGSLTLCGVRTVPFGEPAGKPAAAAKAL